MSSQRTLMSSNFKEHCHCGEYILLLSISIGHQCHKKGDWDTCAAKNLKLIKKIEMTPVWTTPASKKMKKESLYRIEI